MKDTVISAKHKKREIIHLIACFILANLLNVLAIILYKTEWSEIWNMFGYVLVITGVLYGISLGIRMAAFLFKSLYKKVAG